MKKVLVSSDSHGNLHLLLPKVAQLQAKTAFDMLILVGDVCAVAASSTIARLRAGEDRLPLPAYFIDDSIMNPVLHGLHKEGVELAPNFTFLGSWGLKEIQGLQIAFLGGGSRSGIHPNPQQIDKLSELCKNKTIDILLSNQWSKEVKKVSQKSESISCQRVGAFAAKVNPKYHLAAGGQGFFRLSPYRNGRGAASHFINVAGIEGQLPKDKYLFGINLQIGVDQTKGDMLENIYNLQEKKQEGKIYGETRILGGKKRGNQVTIDQHSYIYFQGFPSHAKDADISQFLQRWGDIKKIECFSNSRSHVRTGIVKFSTIVSTKSCLEDTGKFSFQGSRIKFIPKSMADKYRNRQCWFCVSKEDFDQSLVVFRGKYCYVSMEKGPLSPFHLQLIPYNHVESSGRLEREEIQELQVVRTRLSGYFESQGEGVLSYQRYLRLSEEINHCIVHVVPLGKGDWGRRFRDLNRDEGLGFREATEGQNKGSYFIEGEIEGRKWRKEIGKRDKVQSDFMRQVICDLIGKPQRVSWKNCVRSPEDLKKEKDQILTIIKEIGL